ncbi:MAG TPA: hypothetical protein VIO11_03700, partial [Candidatus Methanoperedens sp.]
MKKEDGQFMLLSAFIIAIGLVITTVILNSIIFDVNKAAGGGNELPRNEMVNLMQVTKGEVQNSYWRANKLGGDTLNTFNKQMSI